MLAVTVVVNAVAGTKPILTAVKGKRECRCGAFPGTVSFLSPQPSLSLGDANRPSCPATLIQGWLAGKSGSRRHKMLDVHSSGSATLNIVSSD